MCLGKEEEPCGHLEQLSSILGPEQGGNSLLGRFLGCLQMTSYFLSEKQNGVYNLTAKKLLPFVLHLLSLLSKALELVL